MNTGDWGQRGLKVVKTWTCALQSAVLCGYDVSAPLEAAININCEKRSSASLHPEDEDGPARFRACAWFLMRQCCSSVSPWTTGPGRYLQWTQSASDSWHLPRSTCQSHTHATCRLDARTHPPINQFPLCSFQASISHTFNPIHAIFSEAVPFHLSCLQFNSGQPRC